MADFPYGTRTVTGQVVNNGVPVPNVIVHYYAHYSGEPWQIDVMGNNQTTTTDANGNYSLTLPQDQVGGVGGGLSFTYNGKTTDVWPFNFTGSTFPTYNIGDPLVPRYKTTPPWTLIYVPQSQASKYFTYLQYDEAVTKANQSWYNEAASQKSTKTTTTKYSSSTSPNAASFFWIVPILIGGATGGLIWFLISKHKKKK